MSNMNMLQAKEKEAVENKPDQREFHRHRHGRNTHCSFSEAYVLILFNPLHIDLLHPSHVMRVENSVYQFLTSAYTGKQFLPGEND